MSSTRTGRWRLLGFAEGIGGADHASSLNAAASDCHAETVRPMIATFDRVEQRCSAEFASAKHDRVVEQIAGFQLGNQSGKRGVEDLASRRLQLGVVDVMCPQPLSVTSTQRNAGLDQAQGRRGSRRPKGVSPVGLRARLSVFR